MGETETLEQPPLKKERKPKEKKPNGLALIGDTPAETTQQRIELILPHYDGRKILATIDNLRALLHHYKVIVRYSVITKRIFFTIPGESFSMENGEDAAFACIFSLMKQNLMPTDGYQPYLMRIADENQYNPVLEWVTSKPWDGKTRLPDLYKTITSEEEEAKELLIRRWLITAICMAKGEGVDSAGCLVLQGAQDLGKTWWVRKLVPEALRSELIRTDASVNPADKDSVSQIISYWICELGEIGATFRKSDIDALKAFITRDHDTMRRPYGIGDKRYPRRTALVASVDQSIYLHDTAGNRRFWTIPCTAINSYHDIDMQQVWAEVLEISKTESWQLQPDEKAHIKRINEEHAQIEPIVEMMEEKYFNEQERVFPTWKTATAIAGEIGIKNVSQRETRTIASYLKKRGTQSRKAGGSLLFFL
jgi:putative DNA primase/helicase